MSLDEDIRRMVRDEVRAALSDMFQGDRRSEPRPKNGTSKLKGTTRTCPFHGCKNGWRAISGGWCAEHLNTKGAKAWAAGHKKAAKKR